MRWDWSEEVYEMEKELKPYFDNKNGGIRDDSPAEIKELYEKFCKKVDEEAWL